MLFCRNALLARRGTVPSGSETVDFPASASAASAVSAAAEHKTGKFWRPFAMHSSSNSAAAAAASVAGGSAPVSGSIGLSRSDAVVSSGSSSSGFPPEDGGSAWDTRDGGSGGSGGGGGSDSGRGWRTQRSKRSLPGIGTWRRNSEPPASSSHPAPGKGVLSPLPRSRVRPRPSSISGVAGATASGGVVAGTAVEDEGESAKSWLSSGRRVVRGDERGTVSGVGVRGGAGGVGVGTEGGGEPFETVAKVPPWMEGVEASAEYDEIKPTLDVIKQTVLLAMLQQVGAASRPVSYCYGALLCLCVCVCAWRICLLTAAVGL